MRVVRLTVLCAVLLLAAGLRGTPASEASEARCAGAPTTIVGSPGNDVLIGTGGDDVIVGLGGDDRLVGLGGNDRLCGGPGADVLSGGRGDDRLRGGEGDDVVTYADATRGVQVVSWGPARGEGEDDLAGFEGVVGSPFADRITIAELPSQRAWGGGGDDVLIHTSPVAAAFLYGGPGDDTIVTLFGFVGLYGGPGDDHLTIGSRGGAAYGGPGDDRIDTGVVHDSRLVPGPGDDRVELHGCEFSVSISFAGARRGVRVDLGRGVAVGDGRDVLVNANGLWNGSIGGSSHDDVLIAGTPMRCGDGAYLVSPDLDGLGGDDRLHGGPADDRLIGGDGTDLAEGRGGNDSCDAEVVRRCES